MDIKKLERNVRFFLWTRRNGQEFQQLKIYDVGVLRQTNFDCKLPTKIFIHGFTMSAEDKRVLMLRDAFLEEEDCNFIAVDWKHWARLTPLVYYSAMVKVKPVGQFTGEMIRFLIEQCSNPSLFHLIGFSLGAHVVGIAGATVGCIGRITGLDPAGPGFEHADEESRLSPDDANLVDVIHTCTPTLGIRHPVGHVDFYADGGGFQPGYHNPICEHEKSLFIFIESVKHPLGDVPRNIFATRKKERCLLSLGLKYADKVSEYERSPASWHRVPYPGTFPQF